MTSSFKDHLVLQGSSIKDALLKLNNLASDSILFVVDEKGKLIGSLTDGDVRRGLIAGMSTGNVVDEFIQPAPRFIKKDDYSIDEIIKLRKGNFKVIPVLDQDDCVINVINFGRQKSYLPLDAIIMAGGRGSRLRPMTDTVPKPLLEIDGKPIIDHNLDRLRLFGIDDFWISIRYLGEQLEEHYGDGKSRGVNINFLHETEPLGTIGAVGQINGLAHDNVLVTNSDLLTTLDYEDFFLDFLEKEADMSIATIPYNVDIPYAVMETNNNMVTSFKEKPTYTYYSNGGIYLIKKNLIDFIPKNVHFNATDLMLELINQGKKVVSYPLRQYWLDIGKPDDFKKAQEDVRHLKLDI